MVEHIQHVAELGHGALARSDISPGLRMTMHGRYCIFFRQDDTTMTVIRILHGNRDLTSFDFNGNMTRQ